MWRPLLLGGVLPCIVTGAATSMIAWWVGGEVSGWSALAGAGLVTCFFLVGFGCLRLVMASPSHMQIAGALAVFFVQVLLLMALVDLVGPTPVVDGRAFALSGLATALVWQAGQAVVVLRTRRLTYADVRLPGDES